MRFRRNAPNGNQERGALERYLRAAGLIGEAMLAREAPNHPEAQLELEEALRREKDRLPISPQLAETEAVLLTLFGDTIDVICRRLSVGQPARPAMVIGLNGMADRTLSTEFLHAVLNDLDGTACPTEPEAMMDWLCQSRSGIPRTSVETKLAKVVKSVLDGDLILFLEGSVRALTVSTPGWEQRSISEPDAERVVRGPREGFVESFPTNTSLLRRRIRDERLRIESLTVGEVSGTRVGLCYISGICKPALVDEVRRRISRIQVDGILESGYIEEFIEDTPWTVFPLLRNTERPDVAAAALLGGRVVILISGTPFALIAPSLFNDMMQAPEDHYERFPVVFLLRLLRWGFAVVALLGPSLYVAFTTFHQEMVPTTLLLSIMAAREGVPFPAVIEALFMEVAFEALREAGLRLPQPIGQTIGIVGALVIGQAAVEAGIVSAPMVIVVAMTGIASFMTPSYSTAIALRILRFPMLLLAGTFGAYGITLGVVVIVVHLLSLRSFGVPYFAPLGPLLPADQDDVVYRAPHWANRTRSSAIESLDPTRAEPGQRPGPPKEGDR